MSMKKFDLAKNLGLKVAGRMKVAGIPDRFGQGAAEVLDKREQRKRDAAAGLVPFACKLPADLTRRLQSLAVSHNGGMNGLLAELLAQALNPAAAGAGKASGSKSSADQDAAAREAADQAAPKAAAKKSAVKRADNTANKSVSKSATPADPSPAEPAAPRKKPVSRKP